MVFTGSGDVTGSSEVSQCLLQGWCYLYLGSFTLDRSLCWNITNCLGKSKWPRDTVRFSSVVTWLSCLSLDVYSPFVRCWEGRNRSLFTWMCGCLYVQKAIFPFLSAAWWDSSNIPRRKVLCSRCWADFWPITFFLVRSKEPTWSPAFLCNQVSSIFGIGIWLRKNPKHLFYQYLYLNFLVLSHWEFSH